MTSCVRHTRVNKAVLHIEFEPTGNHDTICQSGVHRPVGLKKEVASLFSLAFT